MKKSTKKSGKKSVKQLKKKSKLVDVKCIKCGAWMITRTSRFGDFIGCSNFPKCSNVVGKGEKKINVYTPKRHANLRGYN